MPYIDETTLRPTSLTNFCRVFELPKTYPEGFCFGGGRPVTMKMVDWFYPWPSNDLNKGTWPEAKQKLYEFLSKKNYIKPGNQYLVITDFSGTLLFNT